jgi:hypothetical protein
MRQIITPAYPRRTNFVVVRPVNGSANQPMPYAQFMEGQRQLSSPFPQGNAGRPYNTGRPRGYSNDRGSRGNQRNNLQNNFNNITQQGGRGYLSERHSVYKSNGKCTRHGFQAYDILMKCKTY